MTETKTTNDLTKDDTQGLLMSIVETLARLEAKLEGGQRTGSLTMKSELLTIQEASLFLKCSTRSIIRMIDAGTLRAERFGRNVRLRRRDVEALPKRDFDPLAR